MRGFLVLLGWGRLGTRFNRGGSSWCFCLDLKGRVAASLGEWVLCCFVNAMADVWSIHSLFTLFNQIQTSLLALWKLLLLKSLSLRITPLGTLSVSNLWATSWKPVSTSYSFLIYYYSSLIIWEWSWLSSRNVNRFRLAPKNEFLSS